MGVELETMGIVNSIKEICCKCKQRNSVVSDMESEIKYYYLLLMKDCDNENITVEREDFIM